MDSKETAKKNNKNHQQETKIVDSMRYKWWDNTMLIYGQHLYELNERKRNKIVSFTSITLIRMYHLADREYFSSINLNSTKGRYCHSLAASGLLKFSFFLSEHELSFIG